MKLKEIDKLKEEIKQILIDNKAIEIKSISLKDKTSIADFMIIASGNSSRHIQALSEILLDKLKKYVENILSDNKAMEIISINLKGKTSIADFMIIASGNSSRHIQALSEILIDELKKKGINNCRLEGRDSNDWKLIDAIDIIIHIFHPEKRKFYDLEKMWSELIPKERLTI